MANVEEKPSTHSNSKEDSPWHRPSLLESVLKRHTNQDRYHAQRCCETSSPAHWTNSRPPEECLAALKPRPPGPQQEGCPPPLSLTGPQGPEYSAPAASGARRQRVFRLEWQGTQVQGVDLPKATLPPAPQAEAPLLKHPHFGKLTIHRTGSV